MRATLLLLLVSTIACKRAHQEQPQERPDRPQVAPKKQQDPIVKKDDRMYTTYFYTAAEAVVHGYEDGTRVRIVAIGDPSGTRKAGTIWEGVVGIGETKLVPTGAGVFGFLSDKKAAILAGTPSSCAVVGYFVKDQDGRYRSNRFFTQLPSNATGGGERVVVWAYEAADVMIRVPKTQKVLATKKLKAGERLEITDVRQLSNQVLEIVSTESTVSVQVYYDQGFIVPSSKGRGSGTDFYTFVGALTNGVNDLDLIGLGNDARVKVTDLESGKVIFDDKVRKDGTKTIELTNRYVRVQSDQEIQVVVAAFEHLQNGYAEHHFATGREGGGIDNDFRVTTSGGLWLFSYFADNTITVTNVKTGAEVYTGMMQAGMGHELDPGAGLYRVRSSKGSSVMGGASTCGADYSPAAGMFAVDDAMLKVIQQVVDQRIQDAKTRGVTLSPEAAAAPMNADEWERYGKPAAKAAGYSEMKLEEGNERKKVLEKK